VVRNCKGGWFLVVHTYLSPDNNKF
jgi:hypothetical protein